MSRCRLDLINKAFAKMDVTGDGVITADDLKRSYDVTQHPKFKTGEWSRERILKEFLNTFQLGEKDDVVTCIMLYKIELFSAEFCFVLFIMWLSCRRPHYALHPSVYPSDCPSVCPAPTVNSKTEHRSNFQGKLSTWGVNGRGTFRSRRQRSLRVET